MASDASKCLGKASGTSSSHDPRHLTFALYPSMKAHSSVYYEASLALGSGSSASTLTLNGVLEEATSLSERLKANRTDTSLVLNCSFVSEGAAHALAGALRVNSALTSISLNRAMSDKAMQALLPGLKANRVVSSLTLSGRISDEGCRALQDALAYNCALSTLSIDASMSARAAQALARCLVCSSGVASLVLKAGTGNEAVKAFCGELRANCGLTSLELLSPLSIDLALALQEMLIASETLQSLTLREPTAEAAQALRDALRLNQGLTSITFTSPVTEEVRQILDEALMANRRVTVQIDGKVFGTGKHLSLSGREAATNRYHITLLVCKAPSPALKAVVGAMADYGFRNKLLRWLAPCFLTPKGAADWATKRRPLPSLHGRSLTKGAMPKAPSAHAATGVRAPAVQWPRAAVEQPRTHAATAKAMGTTSSGSSSSSSSSSKQQAPGHLPQAAAVTAVGTTSGSSNSSSSNSSSNSSSCSVLVLEFRRQPTGLMAALSGSDAGLRVAARSQDARPRWAGGALVLVPGLDEQAWRRSSGSLTLGHQHALVLEQDQAAIRAYVRRLALASRTSSSHFLWQLAYNEARAAAHTVLVNELSGQPSGFADALSSSKPGLHADAGGAAVRPAWGGA
eukprot:CAMPEP_0171177174 /NCGR_PEP_ID=MMETSP0790-20130122/12106_1 /TAXON_ID=2925 /ORGANISM="Alexandrium catenella, Strain OF101" /LENGTH=628 /DNA_ID=CAMNT_0011642069 /DNA_START=43 /DNA_END=1929 /DNA_ORIENTATION=+